MGWYFLWASSLWLNRALNICSQQAQRHTSPDCFTWNIRDRHLPTKQLPDALRNDSPQIALCAQIVLEEVQGLLLGGQDLKHRANKVPPRC